MLFSMRRLAGGFAAILLAAQTAGAAEIKVYSTIGVKSVLEELAPNFEKATGHKLNISWGLISSFTKKAQEGDVPDVLVVSRAGIDSLSKDGKIAAGGPTLAASVIAVAVKQGAAKPDISTSDALKKTLLAAHSIGYTNPAAGGATGVYFAKVIERLGIAGEVKAKSKFPPPAGFVGDLLVKDEVDLAIQSKPELSSIAGVEVVGPFPGDLANTTVFAAGVGAASKEKAAGTAFLKFLTSPEALAVFKAKGFDPA
ncbi:MAG TPA: substrate-binding domain-containing protein [Pseudolabrys sp.]|jgi:molybdate transport system substrate-binding protein